MSAESLFHSEIYCNSDPNQSQGMEIPEFFQDFYQFHAHLLMSVSSPPSLWVQTQPSLHKKSTYS